MLLWTLLERRLIKKKMLCLFYTRKACGRRRLRAYIYCWSLVPPLHQLSVCVSGKCPFYTPGRRVDRVRSGTPGDSRYAIVSAIQLPSCQINNYTIKTNYGVINGISLYCDPFSISHCVINGKHLYKAVLWQFVVFYLVTEHFQSANKSS